MLCRSGAAIPLTDDHKAAREDETVRALVSQPHALYPPPVQPQALVLRHELLAVAVIRDAMNAAGGVLDGASAMLSSSPQLSPQGPLSLDHQGSTPAAEPVLQLLSRGSARSARCMCRHNLLMRAVCGASSRAAET